MIAILTLGSLLWLYKSGAIVLALAAALTIAWALLFDRARTRLRCPRCWYDLSASSKFRSGHTTSEPRTSVRPVPLRSSDSGAPQSDSSRSRTEGGAGGAGGGLPPHQKAERSALPSLPLTCPECGKRITRPRQLRRTRRRWRIALAALPLLFVAYEFPRIPAIQSRGYPAAIPTLPLTLLTDPTQLDIFVAPTAMPPTKGDLLEELEHRIPIAPWQGAVWNHRIRRAAQARGLATIPDALRDYDRRSRESSVDLAELNPPTALAVLQAIKTQTGIPWRTAPPEMDPQHEKPIALPPEFPPLPPLDAAALIIGPSGLDPWKYAITLTREGLCLHQWAMQPNPKPVPTIRTYDIARHLDLATWPFDVEPPKPPPKHAFIHDPGPTFPREEALENVVELILTFVTSESWRGNGGELGIILSFDHHSLIIRTTPCAHVQIERLLHDIEHPPSPPFTFSSSTPLAADLKRTVVYDITPIIAAHPEGKRFEDIVFDLAEEILDTIDSPGWRDNGGDTSMYGRLPTRLVIQTTPANHAAIQSLLEQRAINPTPPATANDP